MIPRIIHHIWIGPHDPMPLHEACRRTALRTHPDWEHLYWTNDRIGELVDAPPLRPYRLGDRLGLMPRYDHRSDVVRLAVLLVHGGVYLDHDVWCVRSLAPLLREAFVYGEHGRGHHDPAPGTGRRANGVILSRPNHPAIQRALELTLDGHQGMAGFQKATIECQLPPLPFRIFYPHYHRQPSHRYRVFSDTCGVHCWRRLDYNIHRLEALRRRVSGESTSP